MVVACPALQKHEHPHTSTPNRFHFGKIQRNDAGGGLRLHNIAKLENRFAADDSAFTLNHRQIVQVLNVYGQHGILLMTPRSKNPAKRQRSLFFSLMQKE